MEWHGRYRRCSICRRAWLTAGHGIGHSSSFPGGLCLPDAAHRPFLDWWPRLGTPSGYVTGPPREPWTRSTPSPTPVHIHVVHRTNPTQPRGVQSAATWVNPRSTEHDLQFIPWVLKESTRSPTVVQKYFISVLFSSVLVPVLLKNSARRPDHDRI